MKLQRVFPLILLFCIFAMPLAAQREMRPLRIGISESPPFVILDSTKLCGASIELWENVADSLYLEYRYVRFPSYLSLTKAMKNGEIDFTVNPLTLTDQRLAEFRLTIPFYSAILGMAQRPSYRFPLVTAMVRLINWRTLQMLLLLSAMVVLFSVLIWLSEKRKNSQQFRKGHRGITDGIWWAFVTMTTVGYGDKVPRTRLGKMLTIIWMFYAIALFFLFTAEISSELTITKLKREVTTLEDLRKIRVGTLEETGFAAFCHVNRIRYSPFPSMIAGISALDENKIDAFVADVETLEYLFDRYRLDDRLEIVTSSLNEQYFCFGTTRNNLDLVDRINPVLLNFTQSTSWGEILNKYKLR